MHKRSKILSISLAICLVLVTFSSTAVFYEHGSSEQITEESLKDLSDYIIAIDPGHGGTDPGAVGPSGYTEAECVLDIGLRLRDLLEANGAEVVMTRTADVTVSLSERVDMANNAGADIFVSIHNNAFDGTVQGIETFYWEGLPPDSDAAHLSNLLQTELINEIDSPDRGVKTANFYVLRETWMPASLTENMFIDNPDEEAKLMDPSVRQRIADAHYRAICEYFGVDSDPPGEAEFVLSGWSASPSTVEPGETVTIQGDVENIGDTEDSVPIELYIDGTYADTEWVTLSPGQSTTVTFYHSEDEEGTYDVWVFEFYDGIGDDWEGQFTVEQDTGAPAPPENLAVDHYSGDNPDASIQGELMGEYEWGEWGECECDYQCQWQFTETESISPDPVEVGEQVTISGEVQHWNGDTFQQAAISLWIDGSEVESYVTDALGWHGTESFDFYRTKNTPGTYDVDLYLFWYTDGSTQGGWHHRWSSSFEVVDAGEPEFELSGWSVSPSTVEPGETVTIQGDITNVGDATGDVSAELYIDGSYVAPNWDTLAPGETDTFTHTHSESDEGTYDVQISAWCGTKSAVDDSWYSEFEVSEEGEPQFELSGWSISPSTVEPGVTVTIEGDITNVGDETGDVSAELYIDGSYVAPNWDTLAPGETDTFTHTHSESDVGHYHVEIFAWCDEKGSVDDQWDGDFEVVEDVAVEVETIGSSGVTQDSATLEGEVVDMGGIDAPHNRLTWDASPDDGDVDHYNIYRSEDEGGPWDQLIDSVDADGSNSYQYVDGNAAGEPRYWYVVRAVGTNGIEEGNTDSAPEPVSDTVVEVFFRYRESGATTWTETGKEQVTSEGPFEDTVSGLEPDTQYEFKAVVQWDDDENTGDVMTFTTDDDTEEPAPPEDLEVEHHGTYDGTSSTSDEQIMVSEPDLVYTLFESDFQWASASRPDSPFWEYREHASRVSGYSDLVGPVQGITIHHCAGTYGWAQDPAHGVNQVHQANGWPGAAYDFIIGLDGTIYHGSPLDSLGWHAGDYRNIDNIAISYEGNFNEYEPNDVQYEAGGHLIAYLVSLNSISDDRSGSIDLDIGGFHDVTPHDHWGSPGCPGEYFCRDTLEYYYEQYSNGEDAQFALSGWSVHPHTVNPGETVTVEGHVENIGGGGGYVSVDIYVDGDFEASTPSNPYLSPGESEWVSFDITRDDVGSYDVDVHAFEMVGGEPVFPAHDSWNSEFEVVDDDDLPTFTLNDWSVDPDTVNPGETVTVEGYVENIGDGGGYVSVDIYVDGDFEASTDPNPYLAPSESELVSFDVSRDDVGSYDVDVHAFEMVDGEPVFPAHDSWNSDFEVVEGTDFDLIGWSVSPSTVDPGESVTIAGDVENVGDEEDTVYIQLIVDGAWQDTETVWMLDPGEVQGVSFTHSEEDVGSYSVDVRAVCEDEINIYSMWSSEFQVVGDVEVETDGATDVTTDSAVLHGDLVDIGDEGTEHNLLTWTASASDAQGEVSHYNIYRSENQDGPWDVPLDSVDADGSAEYSYVDQYAGLADDTFWWYVVRAVGTNEVEEGNTDAVQEPEEDANVHVFFRYRESGHSGWTETDPQPMITEGTFSEEISALDSGKEYEFKAVAQWDGQEGLGQIETFETVVEEYTLEIGVEGEGTTDPDPGTYLYDEGTEVTIEAIPDEGWEFSHWSEDEGMNLLDAGGPVTYGFWPYWTDPADYEPDWDKLTHVSVFSMTAQSDGSLYEGNMYHYDDVKAAAEGTDTKVTLTVAQFDQDTQDSILAHHRQDLVDNIVTSLDEYDADGVNIDIEFVRETNSITGESNVDLMEDLLEKLYQDIKAVDEGYHISFCTAGSVEQVYRNSQLSDYADHVFLMGYDYHWGGASNTGPVSPYDSSQYFDVTDSMDILRDYYPDEQLILGLPFYGYEWPAESDEPGAETEGDGNSVFMVDAVVNADEHGRNWHEDSSVPWYAYQVDGQWYQGWYDDEESLQLKWEYVRDEGFGGTGFWALGYETEETWDTLGEVFTDSMVTVTMDSDKVVTAHFEEIELPTMEISLTSEGEADGWNFVSFNLELDDTDLESILEHEDYGISDNYDSVMYYDASADEWLTYVPGREDHFNSLETWDHTMGVWIRMTADDTLTVEGQEPTETTITLYEGWNMVSYAGSEAATGVPDEVTEIGYFDASEEYNVAYTDDVDGFEFSPGEGYWIYADEAVDWIVEY